jgi:hypothetical protein
MNYTEWRDTYRPILGTWDVDKSQIEITEDEDFE